MRSITTKLVTLLALALGPVFCAGAAQKVNPLTQINWPLVTGTGAPSGSCTSSNYGQPYTNTANGNFYVCASSGWVQVAGGGGGGIGGSGTVGYIPKFVTNTTTIGNSAIDDGVTTANTITSTKPVAINDGTGVGGTVTLTEGTAASASAGKDILYADSTNHCIQYSANGGSFSCLATGGGTPSGTNGVIQIANTAGTAFDSDSTISIDKVAHTVNIGTLPTNHVSIGALGTPTAWNFDTTSPTTAALSVGGGTAAAGKYIDGGTGAWTTLPSSGTVTTTGTPASGDIAAFSGSMSITTATATQINTLIKNLTGCNTATYLYSPQSGTCVAPSAASYQPTPFSYPPASASFTWANQSTSSVTTSSTSSNVLVMSVPTQSGAQWSMLTQSNAFSTPYKITACMNGTLGNSASSFNGLGLALSDGTKYMILWAANASGTMKYGAESWTNLTTYSADLITAVTLGNGTNIQNPNIGTTCLRWRNDGTSFYADISANGYIWTNVYSHTISGGFLTPSSYGWGGRTQTSSTTDTISLLGWQGDNNANF